MRCKKSNESTSVQTDIFRRLKAGDQLALEEIYNYYYPRISQFASNMLSDDNEFVDIVSKSFFKLWQKRETISEFAHVIGFLFTTTRNACITYLRQRNKDSKSRTEYAFHLSKDFYNPDENGEQDQALIAMLENAINQELQGNKKKTLQLSMKGLDNAEIAQKLRITVETVQNYKSLALAILRRRILEHH